jgi:hypothetical protein
LWGQPETCSETHSEYEPGRHLIALHSHPIVQTRVPIPQSFLQTATHRSKRAELTVWVPDVNRVAHISDPFGMNVATSNPVAIPYMHPEIFTDGAAYWAAAVPGWYGQ